MKKFKFYIIFTACLFLGIVITLVSCKKNVLDATFKGDTEINISGSALEGAVADSVAFTFAIWPVTLKDTVITATVQIAGNLSDKDRTFQVQADNTSTAVPTEYVLPSSFVIKANTTMTSFPIRIKHSTRLDANNTTVRLILNLVQNDNFKPGVGYTRLRVIWSNILIKPAAWDANLLYSVGKWSKVKMQAVIDATGIRYYAGLSYAQQYAIAASTLVYVTNYNAAHPGSPLLDENGVQVQICSNCN